MRKSKLKQTLSMLLAVLMVFMSMNFSVFAEELTAPADETTTTTVKAPAEPPAEEQTPAALAPAPVDEETGTTEENTEKDIGAKSDNTAANSEKQLRATDKNEMNKPIVVTDAEGKVIGGYDDIQTAVKEASSGSIIKLQQDVTTDQTIQYGNKNLTFDGDSQKYKITSSATRIFILDGTGDSGTALTLKDLNVIGNGTGQRGVHVGNIEDADNSNLYRTQITLDNAVMAFKFSTELRGINFGNGQHQGTVVTLTNHSKILNGLNQEYENDWGSSDTRGVALYNPKEMTVRIEDNSEIKGFKYAINVYGVEETVGNKKLTDAEGLNVIVDNSTIYGWAAFNIWASYGTYNIQNGSVLKGINTVEGTAESANAFTTIKLNYDWPAEDRGETPVYQAYDNVLNITDSTITNGKTGSFDQYLLNIDNAETVKSINLTGAHFVDVTGTIDSAIIVYDDGNKSGSVSKAIDAVKAKTTIDTASTSLYQPAEGEAKSLPFYDIVAVNGEKEYQNIQDAIDDAVDNDTITVKEGIHNIYQAVKVDKPVTIKGDKNVIITPGDTWTPDDNLNDSGEASLFNVTSDNVTLENLTVQGARKVSDKTGHGINIYCADNVSLKNITAKDNAGCGIVVNSSSVTAEGLYTSGNGWYGVNVDQGSGVINDTQFTLNAPYRFGETYQIVSDKYNSSDNIEVNLPDAFVQSDLENGSVYWNDSSTMIKNQNKNRTYPTIQAAIEDANRNNTILIPAGTYAEDLNITQSVILKKVENAESDCVLDGNITMVEGKKVTLSDLNAGTNAAVMIKKGANLALINSDAFVENQHITVEKLFGTEYDTSIIKQNDQEVAKDKLSFVYLGEEIKPDTNLFKADEVSYTVKTPAQFYWLSQQINGGSIDTSKVTIKLGNDLDFHNDEWLPVGTAEYPYQGSFDGQNHKIENLKIARPVNTTDSVGLFGQVNNGKEFKDITIQTASISGNEHVSAFIGKGYVISLIDNIHIKNAELVGTHFAGGVVGQGYVTNLQNCIAENVTVTLSDANKKSDGDKAGAIIGQLCEGNMTLRNCTVTDATVSGVRDVGGIIGMAQYGNILQNCTVNGGSVTAVGEESSKPYVGGVVGRLGGDGTQKVTIYQCSSNETTVIGQEGYTGSVYGGPAENFVAAAAFNTNTGKIYTAIQAAIDEATAGDTIEIQAGTYDEAVTLTKAVNLIGPYADTEIKAEEATTDNRPDESEAILTGGITINRTDNAQNPSITISGLKFKTKGIQATGWGSDPKLENVTITDNVFDALRPSGNVAAIHFNLDGGTPAKNLTIDNNRITNVGDPVVATPNPSGINTDVVEGKTNITDNYIDGTNHSSLQISGTAKGEVTITGNTFKNWDQNYKDDQSDKDGGGRAMRFGDFSGASLTVSQNKMVRDFDEQGLDKDQMVKFTKVPASNKTVFDFSLNYWNGKLPVTTYGKANDNSVIVVSEGTAKINTVPYFTDEAMTITRIPAEVFASDGTTSKGQYLTIQEAIDADSTEDGNIIQLADGVYTDTFSLSKNVTVKGAENGKSILQCTADPSGSGENAAILNMGTNKTAKVQNVEFNITKTGQSPINFSTAGSLTIEGCNFTGTEKVYGSNVIYGGGQKDATVIFKNNTVNLSYRMAITSLGKNSEVTGNTFNIGTDRVGDNQRTSILTIVAAEGTVNISDNIFMGANRAVGVDHSGLKAEQITIKDNQFIDVRYGLELGSTANKDSGVYDLSKNYYATTINGNEVASPMLIEDADKSGSHFDGSTDYTGDQVNIYPYYTKRAFNEETQKYVLSGLYAPVEVQHIDGEKSTEYFGTIAKAYEATHAGDTIVINKAQDGSDAVITENIDMNKVKAELKLMGSTTFSGTFAGSTLASMILQNGTTATFTNAELNAIQYFTSVDVENFNADVSTRIVAPTANTSQNSFIAKGGLMDYVKGDPNSTWIYGSPSDQFNGGDGTAETPWQINIPEQLKLLQTPEFKTKDKYFKLTNDITVSDWTALAKFEGNFDGNGYTFTGNNVNFIDDLAKGAKVEKLRFEGFTNLVNTNNGTVENCFTVGEKPTAIVNIMGGSGTLTDSFTAGTIAVQTNEARGTVLRVYHCGETGGIGTAMTKADMQKARFANTLNGNKEGIWGYDADVEAPSAYPYVLVDGKINKIEPIQISVSSIDETGKILTVDSVGEGPYYAKDIIKLKANVLDKDYLFNGWYQNEILISDYSQYEYTLRDQGPISITAKYAAKPAIQFSVMNGAILGYGDGNGSVTINDADYNPVVFNGKATTGSSVTLKAKPELGSQFSYWRTMYDEKPISYDAEYTFNVSSQNSKEVYVAVFNKKAEDVFEVLFINQGQVYQKQNVKNGETLQPVSNPTYIGKTFIGWVDEEGNDFALTTPITKNMTLVAKYEDNKPSYTVKVENGSISPQKESYTLDEKVTITAEAAPENQHFIGWVKKYTSEESSVISYEETYSFYVNENVTYIAKYGQDEVEPQPIAGISQETTQIKVSGTGDTSVYGIKFIGNTIIPENYTGISTGFIFLISDADEPLTIPSDLNKDFIIGSDKVVVGSPMATVPVNGYQFTKGKGGLKAGQTIAARTYLTCLNSEGEEVTFYSDVAKATVMSN